MSGNIFRTENITILFAAAGCGKTTYLIERVKEDLGTYRPEEIAFVSFTRKGAYEGRDRILRDKNIEVDADRLEYFKTLHSLCFGELGYKRDAMFTPEHASKFNRILGFNLTTNENSESNTADDKLMGIYEQVRSGRKDVFIDIDGYDKLRYDRLVSSYEEYKKVNGLHDYTDCLLDFVKRGKSVPVLSVYIDEAQDLTALQWQVCSVAFAKAEKIFVAGDDYQSIYKYAGARPDVLIKLSENHTVVKLETSYRLPRKVYNFAKAITGVLGIKVDKDYAPYKLDDGSVEFIQDHSLAARLIEAKQKEEWLVLFRNNWNASMFEEKLRDRLVPYHTPKGFFMGPKTISLIKKYYNFRKVGYRNEVEKNIFATTYGIKDFTDEFSESKLLYGDDKYLYQAYVDKYGIAYLEKLSKSKPVILVSSIHKVKGGEAKNVAVFMDCTFKVYRNRYRDFDSELRLLYVALTRAKENLYLVRSESKYGLDDILDTLKEHYGL